MSSGVDPFEDGKRAGRPRVVKIGPVLVAVGKIWGDAFGKLGSQIVYVTPEGGVVNCRGIHPAGRSKAAFCFIGKLSVTSARRQTPKSTKADLKL